MIDKAFIDTNILIYGYSIDEPVKQQAVAIIMTQSDEIILSTQVINEFINVMSRKRKVSLNKLALAINELSTQFYVAQITVQTIQDALMIAQKYHYSYFDSLMISSAIENNCTILYTEDMHHLQIIENKLIIKNPFE